MNLQSEDDETREFRIIDNPDPGGARFALVDPDGLIIETARYARTLAELAFSEFGDGIRVRHDEDLVRRHHEEHGE